jgi:hypothetical protein
MSLIMEFGLGLLVCGTIMMSISIVASIMSDEPEDRE